VAINTKESIGFVLQWVVLKNQTFQLLPRDSLMIHLIVLYKVQTLKMQLNAGWSKHAMSCSSPSSSSSINILFLKRINED
jgi:hypothetical protein